MRRPVDEHPRSGTKRHENTPLRPMDSRVFYIFTIITNCTHQIVILRMPPTSIAVVRSFTYIFATFAHVAATVACHASAELAGPLRRVPDVTGRWAQPAAANSAVRLPSPVSHFSSSSFLLPRPTQAVAASSCPPPSLHRG